ncbi:hypothetical protein [Micromonospora sp. CA-246542]|uniref:hypothetical protein n=1 Tax=Micromonospora sp. CA-246542 TaxID=3239959 RepID=UPI003D91293F
MAFEEIARKYYGNGEKNLLTVPPTTYSKRATNGVMVDLGLDLYNWRREGRHLPEGMPESLREFLEYCGAIGDWAKSVAPSKVKYSTDARWVAFGEIARDYYGNGEKNLLTVPPKLYQKRASNGIMVHLGQNLADWRREGKTVPKSMPDDLRDFLEYCGAIGAVARAITPKRGAKKGEKRSRASARFSEGAGVVSGDRGEQASSAVGYSGGYGGQVPDRVGTPSGYERQYAGTEWESFRPIDGSAAHLTTGAGGAGSAGGYVVPAGPAQQSAVGAYSYGGYAVTEDYRSAVYSGDGAYLSGYGGQYAGTGGESYQQFDPNAAHITTSVAGPAPTGPYYDNSGNPPPADYSQRAPGNRRSPRP